jgi:hypothetical protein
MLQSDTHASRSMDMDGWVGGFYGGKRSGYLWGGHNDEVDDSFSSSALPVVDLPWFGVFTVASF